MKEPNKHTKSYKISQNTLVMMDESMKNLKTGKVGEPIDFSAKGESQTKTEEDKKKKK